MPEIAEAADPVSNSGQRTGRDPSTAASMIE